MNGTLDRGRSRMTTASSTTAARTTLADVGQEIVAPRRAPRPWALLALSTTVAVVLVAPLAFLLIEVHGAGTSTIVHLIFRSLTASLLWNTVRLTVVDRK